LPRLAAIAGSADAFAELRLRAAAFIFRRLAGAVAAGLAVATAAIPTDLIGRAAIEPGRIARAITAVGPTKLIGRAAIIARFVARPVATLNAAAELADIRTTVIVAGSVAFLAADFRRRSEGSVVAAAVGDAFAVAAFLILVRAALLEGVITVVAARLVDVGVAAEFVIDAD
jgi:hypothetical protein